MTIFDSLDFETIQKINSITDNSFSNFTPIPEGGTASSYIAHNDKLDRDEFIKVYNTLGIEKGKLFLEPRALSGLDNEHIVKIYNVLKIADYEVAIFMECIRGGSLTNLLGRDIALHRTIDIVISILYGTAYLHANNYIHRDLKPGNILVRDPSSHNIKPVIADLGSVLKVESGKDKAKSASRHTYFYRPPEAFRDGIYTYQADIYQVGILLYELINGPLNYSLSEEEVYILSKKGKLIETGRCRPYYTNDIHKVIKKAIRPDFSKRYLTSMQFIDDLSRLKRHVPDWNIDFSNDRGMSISCDLFSGMQYNLFLTKKRDNQFRLISRKKHLNGSMRRYCKDIISIDDLDDAISAIRLKIEKIHQ